MDSKAAIQDLDSDNSAKTMSGDDQDNECKSISEVKINFEACGVSDSQSSHNTPSPSIHGSNLSFNFNPDRVIEETLKVEKSFMQYVMSIPISPGRPRSPAPMMVGLDHLDNLCRLMEQLSELREQNSQLKKRVAFLEDIKCLQEMHNRLIMNSCICQNTFPTKAITTTGPHMNSPPTSRTVSIENKTKEKDCSVKFKPKRTSKKVDIVGKTQSLSVNKKTRKSRERSKSVSYADELLPKKPKVSKWGRVKEALTKKGKLERMHSAHDTLSPEDTYHRAGEIHECRSEDSGIVHLDETHFEIIQISKDPFVSAEREPSIDAESFLSDASTITPLNSSFEDLNKLFKNKKGMPKNHTPHTSRQSSHSSEVDIRERKKIRNVSAEFIKRRQSSPAICSETEDEDIKTLHQSPRTFSRKYQPLESDGARISPLKDLYGKKGSKTTWGKMKEIMHPKRGSLRKKCKKGLDKYHIDSEEPSYVSIESMEELDDFHPMGLQVALKTCAESMESSEISPDKSRYSRASSSPRILSISQSADASPISRVHKKIKPKLTINIPSEESPPPSRKSRWTKVKQVFIGHRSELSGASSAPASPHAKTSGTTFYVDLEALAALGVTNQVFSKNLQELEEISGKTGITQGETSKPNILSFTLAEDEDYSVKSHTWERKKSRPAVLDVANLKSHSVSPASSGGSHTVNVEELHRNLSESFSKKLRDWERKRSLKECSPLLERKGSSKDKNKGKGEKKIEKDRKDKSKISRHKKEKDTLNKEDMRKEKSSLGRGEITIHTPSGNFRFQGISDEFTMKLLEWEAMKGFSPEYSTLALLDSHHTRSQSMKESASVESPKSKRPRCRSEGSLIDISQNSVERKTSTSSRETSRKRSSSVKPMDSEKADLISNENKENLRTNETRNNHEKCSSQFRPRSCSWKSKYRPAELPIPLMANNRRILKENEMLEMMIADLNEQLEKLELYGERVTLEKGILEAATLQKQQRYEEMIQQLRHELHHLRHINLKLLQQLAKSEKYSSLKYMDMWKSTHDAEKIYECSLQILNQLKELQYTSQQNNRELAELQWYVLQYQANIVLLQNQVQRQTFQLDSLQKSWAAGIRRRWNTYGGLDSKFKESLDDAFNWKENQGEHTFFCTDAILPRILSPMIHQSTTNYTLKLERFNAITREIELKLHHIIKSPGGGKQTKNSDDGSQSRRKKNTTSEKSCDSGTSKPKTYVPLTKDQLYKDSKKSDSLDFSLLTHSVEFTTPIHSSNLSIPVTSENTTNVTTTSIVMSTTSSDHFGNVNYTSMTNAALTRPLAVVTSIQTVTTSSISQISCSLPSSPKQIVPSHEKKIYSSHASFRHQSSVEQQSQSVHHSPKIDKIPSKLTSPKQHIKSVSKVSQISEPVKTRTTISQTDRISSGCAKMESPTLVKDQALTTLNKSGTSSLDEPFKKKSHIPIYLSPLSPVIPARSPRRLKGEVKTEPQNLRIMNVTPPASMKRRQYACSKSTTTSKTFDEETGEFSVSRIVSLQANNITSQNQMTDVDLPTEGNLDKLTLRTLSEPFLPPHSPIVLETKSPILSHTEKLKRIKMEFLSTENLPLDHSKNLKQSDKKSGSISSGSSGTLHAASTEKISDIHSVTLPEQHLSKIQTIKELSPAASPKTLKISGSPASIRAYLSASRESSLQMSPPVTPKIMRRYTEGEGSISRPSKLKDLFRKKDKKKKQPMGTVGILCQQTLLLAAASPEIKAGDVEYSSDITEKNPRHSFESGDVEPVGTSSTNSSREDCPSPESDIERKQGKGKSSLRKFFRLNR